ncbi:hypothetical protein AMECASPLE_037830 [Ameca splendens]|uniref:Uncharacterized protein n=1 Tax=Ameca splendens TaxID=208324 RepID=A0ABV0YJV8_9TELE
MLLPLAQAQLSGDILEVLCLPSKKLKMFRKAVGQKLNEDSGTSKPLQRSPEPPLHSAEDTRKVQKMSAGECNLIPPLRQRELFPYPDIKTVQMVQQQQIKNKSQNRGFVAL